MAKIYIVDLDGTICEDVKNERGIAAMEDAEPNPDIINRINALHDSGDKIVIFTARTDEHRPVTLNWLKRHNVKYDDILFNKPRIYGYDTYVYIDNANLRCIKEDTFVPDKANAKGQGQSGFITLKAKP